MNGRLWFPQLDVYDCVRRLGALLVAYASPPGIERLFIVDFYLANPPLLHQTKMNRNTRRAFNELRIPRPEKTFLKYPAPPLLFSKMEPVQKEALRAMTGKDLLSVPQLGRGLAQLTEAGKSVFNSARNEWTTSEETTLVRFLTVDFASRAEEGTDGLRQSTGLRRIW